MLVMHHDYINCEHVSVYYEKNKTLYVVGNEKLDDKNKIKLNINNLNNVVSLCKFDMSTFANIVYVFDAIDKTLHKIEYKKHVNIKTQLGDVNK